MSSLIDMRLSFSFSYFVKHGILAKPDTIIELLNNFKGWALLPNIVQGLQVHPTQGMEQISQLQLVSEKKDIIINFIPDRYYIQFLKVSETTALDFDYLTDKIVEIITILHNFNELDSNRLSVVSKDLCKKMSENDIADVNKKLFKGPTIFNDTLPIEWASKQVIQKSISILDMTEMVNIIFDINKVQIVQTHHLQSSPEPRIELGYEINTMQANQTQRFSTKHIKPFIDASTLLIKTIESDMEEIINA